MELKNEDFNLLENVYKYKTLSFKQCWQASYTKIFLNVNTCINERIMLLIKDGYLDYIPEKCCDYRVVLTTKGVETLREYLNIPKYTSSYYGNQIRSMKTSSELRVREKLISHQLSLNENLLKMRDVLAAWDNITFDIALEKEVLNYDYFRPDGTISLKNLNDENMQVYIEQDMGTESRAQLEDKWDRYRRFINANKGDKKLGKMVMLFIIDYDTTSKPPHNVNFNKMDEAIAFREKEVFKTITTLFACVADASFEVYIGTSDEMLDVLKNKLIPDFLHNSIFEKTVIRDYYKTNLGYKIYSGAVLDRYFNGNRFKYAIVSPNKERYVIDDCYGIPLSVIAKAVYMEQTNVYGKNNGLYPYIYLIIPNDAKKFNDFVEYTGLTNLKDVLVFDGRL